MQKQSGNFLLQSLLALTLIFAFMPFFAGKLSDKDNAAQMYAATEQVETAYTAARIYLQEEKDNLPYKKQELSGNDFVDTLESYGLPLGFVPKTSFKQDISLVIDKNNEGIISYLKIDGSSLSKMKRAELARRIGFYAKLQDNDIYVYVPLDVAYSDIVSKKESHENVGFLSELDMDNNSIDKIDVLFAHNGEFETAQFTKVGLFGIETDKNSKNKISDIYVGKTFFQSSDGGSALALSKGELNVGDISLRTIARFGTAGGFESNIASVYEFSMSEDKTGFTGPANWFVRGSVLSDNFNFTVDRLDIGSYIDASRGQDIYVDEDSLQYSSKSGIDVKNIYAANITLRDQTSYGLLDGQSGAVLIDIRPAGTSVLPDVYLDTIDNDAFEIISDVKNASDKTISCKDIISELEGVYNSKSLVQNIICQYVFWQRLESRINLKQCLISGKSDCL